MVCDLPKLKPCASRRLKTSPSASFGQLIASRSNMRLTPQFSGRAIKFPARRERIVKWRARAVAATPCHGPLQLLVRRHAMVRGLVVVARDPIWAESPQIKNTVTENPTLELIDDDI